MSLRTSARSATRQYTAQITFERDKPSWTDKFAGQNVWEDSVIRSGVLWHFYVEGGYVKYKTYNNLLSTVDYNSGGTLAGAPADGPIACVLDGTTICIAYFNGLDLMWMTYDGSFSDPELVETVEDADLVLGASRACAVAGAGIVYFMDRVYAHPGTPELPTLVVKRAVYTDSWAISTCPYSERWEPDCDGEESMGMGVAVIGNVEHVYFAAMDSDWGNTGSVKYNGVTCVRYNTDLGMWLTPLPAWRFDFVEEQQNYISHVKASVINGTVWVFFKWRTISSEGTTLSQSFMAALRSKDGIRYTIPEIIHLDWHGKILQISDVGDPRLFMVGRTNLHWAHATSLYGADNAAVKYGPYGLRSGNGDLGSSRPASFTAAITDPGVAILPRDLAILQITINGESVTLSGRVASVDASASVDDRVLTVKVADALADASAYSHSWGEALPQAVFALNPNQYVPTVMMNQDGNWTNWLDLKDKNPSDNNEEYPECDLKRLWGEEYTKDHTIVGAGPDFPRIDMEGPDVADAMNMGALMSPRMLMRDGAAEMQFQLRQDWVWFAHANPPHWAYDRLSTRSEGAAALAGIYWQAPGEAPLGDPNQVFSAVHNQYMACWDWLDALRIPAWGNVDDRVKFFRRFFDTDEGQPVFDPIAVSDAMGWAPREDNPGSTPADFWAHWHGIRVVSLHGQVRLYKPTFVSGEYEGLKVVWTPILSGGSPIVLDHMGAYGLGYWGLFSVSNPHATAPGSAENQAEGNPMYFRNVKAYNSDRLTLEDAVKFIASKFGILDFDFADYFLDDFSGTLSQWTQTGSGFAVENGVLKANANASLVCNTGFPADYSVTLKAKVVSGYALFQIRRDVAESDYYQVRISNTQVTIARTTGGATDMYEVFPIPFTLSTSKSYRVRMEVRERWITVWIEDILIGSFYDWSVDRNYDREATALHDPILAPGLFAIVCPAGAEFYLDDIRVPELYEIVEYASFGPMITLQDSLRDLMQGRVVVYYLSNGTLRAGYWTEREDGGTLSNLMEVKKQVSVPPNWIRVEGANAYAEVAADSAQGPVFLETVSLASAGSAYMLKAIAEKLLYRRQQEADMRTYIGPFDPTLTPEMEVSVYHPNGYADVIVTALSWTIGDTCDMTLTARRA